MFVFSGISFSTLNENYNLTDSCMIKKISPAMSTLFPMPVHSDSLTEMQYYASELNLVTPRRKSTQF